jgi:hypothetical protein
VRKLNEAITVDDSTIVCKHEIEVYCLNCGYDLDESELEADTCSDCGQTLNLKQSMKIYATSVPSASGEASL